jgi:hypothetical protein
MKQRFPDSASHKPVRPLRQAQSDPSYLGSRGLVTGLASVYIIRVPNPQPKHRNRIFVLRTRARARARARARTRAS